MGKFTFLKAFNSPFIRPKIRLYIGKVRCGTPYFFPRVWKRKPDNTGSYAVPKKIGFDFVGLGWKTKWSDTDYRHEWNPMWSFVFFRWQICIFFIVPHSSHYWESWLYYYWNTDEKKSQEERLKDTIKGFPQIWESWSEGEEKIINYYNYILKDKYKDLETIK
jgi:hypothetical protein